MIIKTTSGNFDTSEPSDISKLNNVLESCHKSVLNRMAKDLLSQIVDNCGHSVVKGVCKLLLVQLVKYKGRK